SGHYLPAALPICSRPWRVGNLLGRRCGPGTPAVASFTCGDDAAGHARADRAGRGAQHQHGTAEDVVVGAAAEHRARHDQVDRGHAIGTGDDAARRLADRAVLARAGQRIVVAAGAARVDRAAVAALVDLQAVR